MISKKDQQASGTRKMRICLFVIVAAGWLLLGAMGQGSNYCSISPKHTMCRFHGVGAACGHHPMDRGLSAAEKKEVLDYHNRFAALSNANQAVCQLKDNLILQLLLVSLQVKVSCRVGLDFAASSQQYAGVALGRGAGRRSPETCGSVQVQPRLSRL